MVESGASSATAPSICSASGFFVSRLKLAFRPAEYATHATVGIISAPAFGLTLLKALTVTAVKTGRAEMSAMATSRRVAEKKRACHATLTARCRA